MAGMAFSTEENEAHSGCTFDVLSPGFTSKGGAVGPGSNPAKELELVAGGRGSGPVAWPMGSSPCSEPSLGFRAAEGEMGAARGVSMILRRDSLISIWDRVKSACVISMDKGIS